MAYVLASSLILLNGCVPSQTTSQAPDPKLNSGQVWLWSVNDPASPQELYEVVLAGSVVVRNHPELSAFDATTSGKSAFITFADGGILISVDLNKAERKTLGCNLSWDGKNWVGKTYLVSQTPGMPNYTGSCSLKPK